jgi:DNA-binding NarL/FixJ family response regulator
MGFPKPMTVAVSPVRRTRVMLADPYPVILIGLKKVMEDEPRFEVIALASTMPSVWKNVHDEQPEVALLDWSTAASDLEITRALLQSDHHRTSIIFLTDSNEQQPRQDMLQLGASGFMSKCSTPDRLRAAVWKACRKPALEALGTMEALSEAEKRIQQLTKRERQLMPLVASGLKNKEIAAELRISESTVWHHLTSIFTKLQVGDRLGLATFAYSHGLAFVPPIENAG